MKGIIFDLDGVLLSTDEFHFQAWKALADKLNIPFDREKNNRLRGISRMASLEIVLEGYEFSEEQKTAFAEEKNNTYRKLLSTLTPEAVSEDVHTALKKLKERGYKLAVGSSSKNTKYILDKVDLLDIFDAIADGNDVTHSKPDPEVFLRAAEKLNLCPCDCLIIEDSEAGIDAGNSGGFTTVGIGIASEYSKTFYKINKLSDILNLKI